MSGHANQMMRVGHERCPHQHLPVRSLSRSEIAAVLELEGGPEFKLDVLID